MRVVVPARRGTRLARGKEMKRVTSILETTPVQSTVYVPRWTLWGTLRCIAHQTVQESVAKPRCSSHREKGGGGERKNGSQDGVHSTSWTVPG